MSKWSKLGWTVGMGSAVLVAAHLINRFIFSNATAERLSDAENKLTFNWKFGDVMYTVSGSGSPVLMIHDLNCYSSKFEWNRIYENISAHHTVYCMDLLGCGESDKPNLTYTAYMYTQLINDFCSIIIKEPTDIVATGASAPLAIMSAAMKSSLFKKIILVSPQDIERAMIGPDKYSNIRRIILASPIIGTTVYNLFMRKAMLRRMLCNDIFYDPSAIPSHVLDTFYYDAHMGGSTAKYLFTSTQCGYTTSSIYNAVSSLDNSIYIISGDAEKRSASIVNEYTSINPSIEAVTIGNAKHLPQIEQPKDFIKQLNLFLND